MSVIAVREYIAPSGGSAKKDQKRAIEQAKAAWAEYKTLKARQRK